MGGWRCVFAMDVGDDGHVGKGEHNNLALLFSTLSPSRRTGSTLNLPPSISPTPNSAFGPPFPSAPSCVPPVILRVFSGTLSLGVYPGSTLVSMSAGGLSAPTLGNSLAIVLEVLVRCGFRGLPIMNCR